MNFWLASNPKFLKTLSMFLMLFFRLPNLLIGAVDLEGGVQYWKGYYQSLRPTQMGLSFTVDGSAMPFYAPINVVDFVSQYLGKGELSGPLCLVLNVSWYVLARVCKL